MHKSNNASKKALYPITYKGVKMYEKDCSGIFASFYRSVDALGYDMSVYVSHELGRVLPDGEWSDDY